MSGDWRVAVGGLFHAPASSCSQGRDRAGWRGGSRSPHVTSNLSRPKALSSRRSRLRRWRQNIQRATFMRDRTAKIQLEVRRLSKMIFFDLTNLRARTLLAVFRGMETGRRPPSRPQRSRPIYNTPFGPSFNHSHHNDDAIKSGAIANNLLNILCGSYCAFSFASFP